MNEAMEVLKLVRDAVAEEQARSSAQIAELTRQRDEALQSFRAAIELEGPQKYATLLDERDALAGKLDVMQLAIEKAPHAKDCTVAEWELRIWAYGTGIRNCKHPGEKPACKCWKSRVIAALNPAPSLEANIPPSC